MLQSLEANNSIKCAQKTIAQIATHVLRAWIVLLCRYNRLLVYVDSGHATPGIVKDARTIADSAGCVQNVACQDSGSELVAIDMIQPDLV